MDEKQTNEYKIVIYSGCGYFCLPMRVMELCIERGIRARYPQLDLSCVYEYFGWSNIPRHDDILLGAVVDGHKAQLKDLRGEHPFASDEELEELTQENALTIATLTNPLYIVVRSGTGEYYYTPDAMVDASKPGVAPDKN